MWPTSRSSIDTYVTVGWALRLVYTDGNVFGFLTGTGTEEGQRDASESRQEAWKSIDASLDQLHHRDLLPPNHPLANLRAFRTTAMEDAPPPTEHILRPHHLVLLSILMIAFKDLEIKKFPPEFSTHLLRTLLNEVSEVRGKGRPTGSYLDVA